MITEDHNQASISLPSVGIQCTMAKMILTQGGGSAKHLTGDFPQISEAVASHDKSYKNSTTSKCCCLR